MSEEKEESLLLLYNKRKKKKKFSWNLVIFAISELLGGFTFSLLSPFYTDEAVDKGVSVSQTGFVYGTAFITTIIFSPIFGKYIREIGSKELFVYGTFVAGSTSILFGMLQWVEDSSSFLILSFLIRIVGAIGEAAFFSSIYPLAADAADENQRSTVLSVMETMFGIGLMLGPFFGGVLYTYGGFALPFLVCGGVLICCSLIAKVFISVKSEAENSRENENVGFIKLISDPTNIICCLLLTISSTSVSWYLPSLQPFLEDKYSLDSIGIGILFMLDGATYAFFSPLWGWRLDHGLKPVLALMLGTLCILIGFTILGPVPILRDYIPNSIYVVGIGLFIHGIGTAANFITTLTYMMSNSVENGAPDIEKTRAIITSLWFISECVGGYIGSSLGGFMYDLIGFESSTYVIIGILGISLIILLPILHFISRKQVSLGDYTAI